ncbi:MAG: hypothetical protein IT310_10615 [Anaerolineales bacterium]|nr:hypothetical protein [Anaerolineales bacterium]
MLKFIRPSELCLTVLTYALGGGISVYLNNPLRLSVFTLGLSVLIFAQMSMNLLAGVFRPHNEPLVVGETPRQKEVLRNNLLYVALIFLTGSLTFSYLLLTNYAVSTLVFYFLALFIGLAILYALPPFRLNGHGFGELTLAALIAYLAPALGFALQTEDDPRLLRFVIVPLTALALTYFLTLNFPTFTEDEKYQRGTLLRLLTWERAIPLLNGLLAFAYLAFVSAPLFGFSLRLVGTAFLILPLTVFQAFQLHAIRLGGKPNWRVLTSTAFIVFAATVGLLCLTFWR